MTAGWHTYVADDHPAAMLLTARAIRERCGRLMAAAEHGDTSFWRWREERLRNVADYVCATIRERHPTLAVPFHSRWRHFETHRVDRWKAIADAHQLRGTERARAQIDLAVTSVLLDAGAGPRWRYRDATTGEAYSRSEGLALASLGLFAAGAFSADRAKPLRVDAAVLESLDAAVLANGFQATVDNPLVGVAERAALLRRLGAVAAGTPVVFGSPARPGNLFDYVSRHAAHGAVTAEFLLETLLRALGPVWPSRLAIDGVALGDCWRHPAARGDPTDPTDGLVPFHKLTQWLLYSLLEPFAEAGIEVSNIDVLTGLPEYRNGGLLLDLGALVPRAGTLAELARSRFPVDHPLIVEWRALTVIALDRVADAVRERLGVSRAAFPLARVLEGGTWAAGRRIALERRADGSPPLMVESDGTVF